MSNEDILFDPAIFGHNRREFIEDPYPFYARMRSGHPLYRSPRFGGAWMAFRYRDVAKLLVDKRLSSARAWLPAARIPNQCRREFAGMFEAFERWMAFKDGAGHRAARRHADHSLAYLTPDYLTAGVRAVIDQLRRQLRAAPTIDIIGDFAEPLPAMVIAELIGAPPAMVQPLKTWSDDVAHLYGSTDLEPDRIREIQVSALHMLDYLRELTHDCGPDTILARLLGREVDGYRPSPEDAVAVCVQLLFAGMEPVRYLIGNAVQALNRHPDQLALLRKRPDLMPLAIEEFIRYDTPVQFTSRVAGVSFEYLGQQIKAGEPVLCYSASAHRDPQQWDRPDELDLTRSPNRHLGFGRGPHLCLGAPLARVVCREALAAILQECPTLTLRDDGPLDWNTNLGFRGVRSLRLDHDAGYAKGLR